MSGNSDTETELGEVIFEFLPLGVSIKVSAIHVASGTEVSIIGPERASRSALERNAVAKLRYVLNKRSTQSGNDSGTVC